MAYIKNVKMVQKQIKAFNKAWARADSAKVLSMEYNDIISDLVGADKLTKGGYAKAGVKYLQSLSDYQLAALSADIQQAREAIDIAKISDSVDIRDFDISDPKSAIWNMYNKLLDSGYQLDSDQVKSLADGDFQEDTIGVLKEMKKVLTDKNYGLADFSEYFNKLQELK